MRCAILQCVNSNQMKSFNREIMFHRFPKEKDLLSKWMHVCGRDFNYKTSHICSIHFTENDYKFDATINEFLSGYGFSRRKQLKRTAVPSQFLALPYKECQNRYSSISINKEYQEQKLDYTNRTVNKYKNILFLLYYYLINF